MARKRRPGKRDLDLRAFWPWYERNTPRSYAEPPPFRLADIHDDADVPLPTSARMLLRILFIVVAVVLLVTVVYAILG